MTGILSEDPIGSVEWEEVEACGKLAFSVWADQPELTWAKEQWEAIADLGLTDYGNEFDRHKVLFRFLVLAGIYHDFCDAAWQVCSEPIYAQWAQPLLMNTFIVGQLYARRRRWMPDDEITEGDALQVLSEAQRSTVVTALLEIFGTTSRLYASLWNSRNLPPEEADGEPDSDDDFTFEADDSQVSAYSWVDEGCPRYRDME